MTNKKDRVQENISIIQLSTWGMLKQIKAEQIVDFNLQDIEDPSDNKLRSIIEEWCKSKQINNLNDLKEWRISNGFNEEQLKIFIKRKWKWNKWCLKKFEKKIPNYFLDRKSMLEKVKYSLIRVKNECLANELYLRIRENEASFEEIAREFSEGPERNTSGNIGPIELGRAHPELSKLLHVSKDGQLWSPRKLDSWWVIVRMNSLENISLDEKLYNILALELGSNFLEKEVSFILNNSLKEFIE
tara:strand:+ start:375 stop:1106 length:732 start_codon:yes stop_codon:yes gene_type:complete